MELATNQFTKGLLMDTHPMVLGNDTLTDCLNGTLITMNGNEVVLLNDMGNRRVDNAFLPPGYEPVGMKEYGGIIYVAAYNPITNKSLIGSFPSPERKMGNEYGENLGGELDLEDLKKYNSSLIKYYKENEDNKEYIHYLKLDSLLIPLTSDTSLHPGDKFTVYSENVWTWGALELLSNFNTIGEINNNRPPQNRLYTLALGILNSLNEFIDITDSLERWNEGNLMDTSDLTSLLKFNKGYFIAKSFTNSNNIETLDDAGFLEERNKKAINTYSYKLVGPLYLKATLNHIESVKYFISGTKSDSGDIITLKIRTTIKYNCPDSNLLFYLYGETFKSTCSEPNSSNPIYEESSNLYIKDITKTYSISLLNGAKNIKGVIGIYGVLKTETILEQTYNYDVFLKNLSKEIDINIEDLGKKEIDLHTWMFKIKDDESGYLTYGFKAYPEPDALFTELLLGFIEIGKQVKINNNYYNISETINDNNGKLTKTNDVLLNYIEPKWITISENDIPYSGNISISELTNFNGYDSHKLYNVIVKYKYNNELVIHSTALWFLGSGLFDDYYNSTLNYNNITEYKFGLGIKDDNRAVYLENTSIGEITGEYFSFSENDTGVSTLTLEYKYQIETTSNPVLEIDSRLPKHIKNDITISNYLINTQVIRDDTKIIKTLDLLNPVTPSLNLNISENKTIILENPSYRKIRVNGNTVDDETKLCFDVISKLTYKAPKTPQFLKVSHPYENIKDYIEINYETLCNYAKLEFHSGTGILTNSELYIATSKIETVNDKETLTNEGTNDEHPLRLYSDAANISDNDKILVLSDYDNEKNGQLDFNNRFNSKNKLLTIGISKDNYMDVDNINNGFNEHFIIESWILVRTGVWVLLDLEPKEDDKIPLDNIKNKILGIISNLNLYRKVNNNIEILGSFINKDNYISTKNINITIPIDFIYKIQEHKNDLWEDITEDISLSNNRINFILKKPNVDDNKVSINTIISTDGAMFTYIINSYNTYPYCFYSNNNNSSDGYSLKIPDYLYIPDKNGKQVPLENITLFLLKEDNEEKIRAASRTYSWDETLLYFPIPQLPSYRVKYDNVSSYKNYPKYGFAKEDDQALGIRSYKNILVIDGYEIIHKRKINNYG